MQAGCAGSHVTAGAIVAMHCGPGSHVTECGFDVGGGHSAPEHVGFIG
jgi:hypothetical protein